MEILFGIAIDLYFLVSYINQNKCRIVEGGLRCSELLDYIDKLKLERIVWLCEDATGINAKIEYDSSSNQLVGLVLPVNPKTGMPISSTFLASSANAIQEHVKKPMSSLVYVILAQPIMPNVPPFVLQIFGTDNRFNTENVLSRWDHTIKELKR